MTRPAESTPSMTRTIAITLTLCMATLIGSCTDDAASQSERVAWYIQGAPYSRLVIELDRVEERDLRPTVRQGFVDGLGVVLDKQSIEIIDDEVMTAPANPRSWSFDSIRATVEPAYDLAVPDDTVKMHIMLLDGSYIRDGRTVLGVAWSHTHVAIFDDTIETSCATSGNGNGDPVRDRVCENTELGILIHEVGHLLGLVDNGLEMQRDHRDEDHGYHDDDPDCVMHWLYDGPELSSRIDAPSVDDVELLGFGPECLEDIAALRGAPSPALDGG